VVVAIYRQHEETLDDALRAFHAEYGKAVDSDNKAYKHRLEAGRKLVELRKRIEAGEAGKGVGWWEWFESHSVRSRKDAEKVMKIALDGDPEAAAEAEKARNREHKRAQREREQAAADIGDVSGRKHSHESDDAESSAAARKAQYAADEDTDQGEKQPKPSNPAEEERWRNSLAAHAGEAIAMRARWKREFGAWQKFKVPSDLVTLAQQAAKEWGELAAHLELASAQPDQPEEEDRWMEE
jgi:hypothetical protein